MTATYLVPECNLDRLTDRIEKLNRRARRLNVPEIAFITRPDHIRYEVEQLTTGQEIGGRPTNLCWRTSIEKTPVADLPPGAYLANAFTPTGRAMQWYVVEVDGAAPTLTGWTFVAVLEPVQTDDGTTLNIIQTLPGETCPESFRTAVGRCDHCHATRKRNQTFVVRHESGAHKCVGRQCIKDFLGYHADPDSLCAIAEMLAELNSACTEAQDDEDRTGGAYRDSSYDLTRFLTLTACRIRLFGWISRTTAREAYPPKVATADAILFLLGPTPAGRDARQEWDEMRAAHIETQEDTQTAEAAIDWTRDLPPAELETSNYLANINVVVRTGIVGRKTAGLAASILAAHAKAQEKEINRQRDAARPESHHVGAIGERIQMLRVTCDKIIASEGNYGTTGIHKLHDAAGNDLTWFASEGTTWLKEGETVTAAATVKVHGDYKGRKQTTLTRLTVWTEEALAQYQAKEDRKAARAAKKTAKA